ncbi:MAG TPA: hypothetical protein VN841_28780 [Bryobacteraceae bacterium]|nr:hypothetical protein [Bryobacteraceae bacterium]
MTRFEIGSLLISALTLGVLLLTLRAVLQYTRETKRLVDATVENLSRPFMTVFTQPDSSDEALIAGCACSIENISTLRFRNDGTGPAVKFRYQIGADRDHTSEALAIAPGDGFDSHHQRNALTDPCEVVLDYESLGGAKYRSQGLIESRRWVKDFTFKPIKE